MIVVFKYPLDPAKSTMVLPQRAQLLHADMQAYSVLGSRPVLWALVDTQKPSVDRRVLVVPTGADLAVAAASVDCGVKSLVHVGTFKTSPVGSLIFHVFDGGEV